MTTRCGFTGCDAVATQHVVLSDVDVCRVVVARPVCLQHLKYELPVREGYKLTITSTSPPAIPPADG